MALNIAHRGGAGLRPENTLAAFEDAVARGCDGAELDVQLSADGEVVVFHDFRLKPALCRDESGAWLSKPTPLIKDLSLAQLQRFDVGRADPQSEYASAHSQTQWRDGEHIPTLAEVIAVTGKSARPFLLFVELKTSFQNRSLSAAPEALAEATVDVLRACGTLDRTLFVGFDWPALIRAKQIAPAAPCWFTTMPGAVSGEVLRQIKAQGGDGWFPDFHDATLEAVAQARALGLSVGAWTVNDAADLAALTHLDALCTDYPDRLQRVLAN